MDLATLIPLALKTGVILNVFVLGLRASPQDATYLFRRPGQLARSMLAMLVVMPLFAAGMIAVFDPHPAVKVALIVLAVSPIPPMLPRKALKAGGDVSYTIGLLVAAALLAVVFVPLAVELLGRVFAARPVQISPMAVAKVVAMTVLAPLAAGLLVRRMAPAFAERGAKPVSVVGLVLLLSILPILFIAMPTVVSLIGNGTVLAIAAFILAGLAAGHLLGGPEPADRTVLALTTSSRHPGVAAAIVSANFPGEKLVLAAILLYLLVNAVVSIPYQIWRRRRHASEAKDETR